MAESTNSTSEYNQKVTIIEGLRAGRTPSEIIKFLEYPESTVYNVARYAISEEDFSTSKFSTSVCVLSAVSSQGDVMPPHFFQKGETVTKKVYLEILKNVVKITCSCLFDLMRQ